MQSYVRNNAEWLVVVLFVVVIFLVWYGATEIKWWITCSRQKARIMEALERDRRLLAEAEQRQIGMRSEGDGWPEFELYREPGVNDGHVIGGIDPTDPTKDPVWIDAFNKRQWSKTIMRSAGADVDSVPGLAIWHDGGGEAKIPAGWTRVIGAVPEWRHDPEETFKREHLTEPPPPCTDQFHLPDVRVTAGRCPTCRGPRFDADHGTGPLRLD